MARVENPETYEGRYSGRPKVVFSLMTGQRIDLTPGEVYTVEVGSHTNVYVDGGYVGNVEDFDRIEQV